jgi:hypothetical protein
MSSRWMTSGGLSLSVGTSAPLNGLGWSVSLAHHEKNGRALRHTIATVCEATRSRMSSTHRLTMAVETAAGSGGSPWSSAHRQNRSKLCR